MGATLDTTFIVDLLRGDKGAKAKARELDGRKEPTILSTPVLYEVSSGLLYRRSRSETAAFRALASRFDIHSFDESSAVRAAEIRAELMRLGRVKGNVDVMLAGIAVDGGHTLVTRDQDFHDIAEAVPLAIESY